MSETQTCPRRMNQWGPWEYKENLDEWRIEPNGDRTCSFCGSLHPEDFERICGLAIADETTRLDLSSKSCKVYIVREGIQNASQGAIKYYMQHNYTDPADIERMGPKFIAALQASKGKFERFMEQVRQSYKKRSGEA